jgi:hypothetical protein
VPYSNRLLSRAVRPAARSSAFDTNNTLSGCARVLILMARG